MSPNRGYMHGGIPEWQAAALPHVTDERPARCTLASTPSAPTANNATHKYFHRLCYRQGPDAGSSAVEPVREKRWRHVSGPAHWQRRRLLRHRCRVTWSSSQGDIRLLTTVKWLFKCPKISPPKHVCAIHQFSFKD